MWIIRAGIRSSRSKLRLWCSTIMRKRLRWNPSGEFASQQRQVSIERPQLHCTGYFHSTITLHTLILLELQGTRRYCDKLRQYLAATEEKGRVVIVHFEKWIEIQKLVVIQFAFLKCVHLAASTCSELQSQLEVAKRLLLSVTRELDEERTKVGHEKEKIKLKWRRCKDSSKEKTWS